MRSWEAMKRRCLNVKDYQYEKYSKLGLEHDWNNYKSFLIDMGERPEGTTLDRIDNSKGYFRGNVRWATYKEQARNTKQTTYITFNNVTKSLGEWADDIGISPKTLWARLQYMELGKALTQPKRGLWKQQDTNLS